MTIGTTYFALRPVMATLSEALQPRSNQPAEPDPIAGLACCGTTCAAPFIVLFVVLILNIALLVWVARDAKNRGMDGAVLWMGLVLVTGVLGLVIYVFARPQGNIARCQFCGNGRLEAARICPHCGN